MQIYLARNNQQAGPYSLDQLNQMLANQQVLLTDLVWHEGMNEWKALGELTQGKLVYEPQGVQISTPISTSPIQNIEVKKAARTQIKTASVAKRIGAKLIDLLLLFIPQCIFLFTYIPFDLMMKVNAASVEDQMKLLQDTLMNTVPLWVPYAILIYTLILLFVQCYLIQTTGQSIGKKIYKLKIVDAETYQLPGQLRGFFIRSFLFLLISQMMNFFPLLILVFIVDIVMFFSKENNSLHDRLAKTKVIDISK